MKKSLFKNLTKGLLTFSCITLASSCTKEVIAPASESNNTINLLEKANSDTKVYPGTFLRAGISENKGEFIDCKPTESVCFIVVTPNKSKSVIQIEGQEDIKGNILEGEEEIINHGETLWYFERY